MNVKLSMVAYACSTSAGEAEAGVLPQVPGQPGILSESQASLSATLEVLDSSFMEPLLLMTSPVVWCAPLFRKCKGCLCTNSYYHPTDKFISGNHAKSAKNDKHHVLCVSHNLTISPLLFFECV